MLTNFAHGYIIYKYAVVLSIKLISPFSLNYSRKENKKTNQ